MTVSDRIAVMNAGRIDQIGSPSDIYNRPRTRFVSDFIGEINLFEGEWRDGAFISNGVPLPALGQKSGRATIAIRPERMRLADNGALRGKIRTSVFVSGQMIYRVATADGRELIVKEADTGKPRQAGADVGVTWNPDDVVVLSD
jgi:ABC-type Fe3+/spermidine/putrescine transport system ATPase subunit